MSKDTNAPSLYEMMLLTRDADLVEEKDTVLTLVLSMIRGGLVLMTGMSRGGKDFTVDAAEYCFPDNRVYQWPSSTSPTAPFTDHEELNSYPVHRFPDLASLDKHIERILKGFGEGREVDHSYTDVTKRASGEGTDGGVLYPPLCQIAFIASDNQDLNLNDYPEVRNRALVMSVDSSENTTRKVTERQAKRRAGLIDRNVSPTRTAQIRQYLGNIPVHRYNNNANYHIKNPGTMAIQRQEPIPYKFNEARQDFDRVLEFMETVGLYHHADRIKYEDGTNTTLLVTPSDCWYGMRVFGQRMIMSTLNLRRIDRAILEYLKAEPQNSFKVSTIQQDLRAAGYNISEPMVRQSLGGMAERGYVRKQDTSPITYTVSEFATHVRYDAGIDWDTLVNGGEVKYFDPGEEAYVEEYVDGASETIYDMVDESTADEYVDRFCEGTGLFVTDPLTGEEYDITENPLKEELEEADEKMEELLEDDTNEESGLGVFEDSQEGDEEEDAESLPDLEEETQGTLV